MNIFLNISHPAHFHFFKNAISLLKQRGHNICLGVRKKEFTIDLLKTSKLDYVVLSIKGKGIIGLIKELIEQQLKISGIIKKYSIDIMLQIGGIFNAPVGKCYGIPTLAFSDTENAIWDNKLSFPITKHVFSPTCFDLNIGGPWKNQMFYPGYHELAYLGPNYFTKMVKPENRFLVRFVGWGAGHDVGEKSLSNDKKIRIVQVLEKYGKAYISSEAPLPNQLQRVAYTYDPSEIHNFMKTCKMVVGESATMASEAAVLGIPAIFISDTGRGYTTEQDKRYGLLKHYRLNQWEEVIQTIENWAPHDLYEEWQNKRWNMLGDKIDVTAWLVDLIENYPQSVLDARNNKFEKYQIQNRFE